MQYIEIYQKGQINQGTPVTPPPPPMPSSQDTWDAASDVGWGGIIYMG